MTNAQCPMPKIARLRRNSPPGNWSTDHCSSELFDAAGSAVGHWSLGIQWSLGIGSLVINHSSLPSAGSAAAENGGEDEMQLLRLAPQFAGLAAQGWFSRCDHAEEELRFLGFLLADANFVNEFFLRD